VVPHPEGPGHEEDEAGEDVAEALLGRDPEHDAGETGSHQQVLDRHLQHGEHGEGNEEVPDRGRQDPYRAPGGRDGPVHHEATEGGRDAGRGDDAGDQENGGADPGDQFGV
jgi:hypothetical protein